MNVIIGTYAALYSIALWASALSVLATGVYGGDLQEASVGLSVDAYEILFIALVMQLLILVPFFLQNYLAKINVNFAGFYISVSCRRFGCVLFFFVIFHIAFVVTTGVGRVFSNATHPLSPIFALTNPASIFYFYYLLVRREGGWFFIANVLAFSLLQIIKGWTGFVLIIFFMELYFFYINSKKKRRFLFSNRFFYVLIVPLSILFLGAFVYQGLYVLKNNVRDVAVSKITYSESISLLANRLTNFPISLGAYVKQDQILSSYIKSSELNELRGFVRPILPASLMNDKSFRAINNSVMLPFYASYQESSSVDVGFAMYYYLLLRADPVDAIFSLCLTCFLFGMYVLLIKLFSSNSKDLDLLVFFIAFSIIYTVSNEMVFSRQYLMMIVYFFVMVLLGVVKFRKRSVF